MVTPYLPYPPASGGQIRTFNLLKYLSKTNDIVLVALYKTDQEKKYVSHLQPYCKKVYLCKRSENPWQLKNILKSLFSFQPFLIVRNFSPEAKRVIKNLIEKTSFDVIHSETFYVMPHIPQTRIPILLVEQTIEFRVYQHFIETLPWIFRIFMALDIFKLRFWEKFFWKKASLVATVSDLDRTIVSNVEPRIRSVVIPNGAGEDMLVPRIQSKKSKKTILLFQGNFSWLQNVEAANYLIHEVYPLLKKKFPHLQLIIAGQHAKKIAKKNDVEYVDIAHEDTATVRKLYSEATLFIAPIFGPGGTRLKLLAAMASGLPVVSTKTGVEGLDVKDGRDVLFASTPQKFVEKIKLILSNNSLYEEIRRNAYRLVQEKYNWKKIAEQLEIVYQKIRTKPKA